MRSLLLVLILALCLPQALAAAPQATRIVSGHVARAQGGTPGAPVPGFPDAEPARGDWVQMSDSSGQTPGPRVHIAEDGSFEFRNVAPGNYRLSVLPTISVPPLDILVGDRDLTDVWIGLPRIAISGTVVLEGAEIHPRFRVSFIDVKEPHGEIAVEAGTAFQAELPPGDYRVATTSLPPGYTLGGITADTSNLETATLHVGGADTPRIAVRLVAKAAGTIVRGRVEGTSPGKVESVTLSGPAMVETLTAAVRMDGSFEFRGVLPGRYEAISRPSPIPSPIIVNVASEPVLFTVAPPDSRVFAGEFVRIQPGEFLMGCPPGDNDCSPSELPQHRVAITHPFEIGKYEVTQAQWKAVMGSNPSQFKGDDRPVENILRWEDAEEFIARLNAFDDGYRYRLPTEAEWEYAARAGAQGLFSANPTEAAWYIQTRMTQTETHPVGQKQPNAWGLYDTMGNVWEWVSDWFDSGYYAASPTIDPIGPSTGSAHVARGGSAASIPIELRLSTRSVNLAVASRNLFGLRIVREPAP